MTTPQVGHVKSRRNYRKNWLEMIPWRCQHMGSITPGTMISLELSVSPNLLPYLLSQGPTPHILQPSGPYPYLKQKYFTFLKGHKTPTINFYTSTCHHNIPLQLISGVAAIWLRVFLISTHGHRNPMMSPSYPPIKHTRLSISYKRDLWPSITGKIY